MNNYYYTERSAAVHIPLDNSESFAAVPMSIKHGPFHTLDELKEHLTGSVNSRGGNGTLFHVYAECAPVY